MDLQYVDCLSRLHALLIDTNTAHVIIAGDLNCSVGSRFFGEFSNFALDNHLVMSDMLRMTSAVTYVSDNCTKSTWIDHVLSSVDVDKMISDIRVINDVIVSDHRPLSLCFQCNVVQYSAPAIAPHSIDISLIGTTVLTLLWHIMHII